MLKQNIILFQHPTGTVKMKRRSLKLGAGLVALATVGAGGSQAMAQSRPAGTTLTDLAFAMAMMQTLPSNAENTSLPANLTPAPKRQRIEAGQDGLPDGAAYMEADQIQRSDNGTKDTEGNTDNTVIGYGNVVMRYKDRTIRADQISYDTNSGVTTASGHVQTVNDDGSVQFADLITYNDQNEAGVSENFASIGADNAKVFARRVEQINPDTRQLTDVIYTPCQLCVKNGTTQDPSWSIEASQITQRKDKHMVYYHDATLRLNGVPVVYTPYMWTPDPELERASGFLPPKIGAGKRRGFSWEQPYLWSISPYQELLISPQLNSKVNPLLNLEYSRHFYSGLLHARMGYTNDSFFDNAGDRIGRATSRDYLLADGSFDINADWRWSFTAQHVNDPTGEGHDYANFFERYNIDNPFPRVGEWQLDSRQLISQVNVTRQVENAYFSISMASFQNLQVGGYLDPATRLQPYAVNSSIYPVIAPMIEGYWSPRSRFLGGNLTLSLNALGLQHKQFPGTSITDVFPYALPNTIRKGGFDTTRASLGLTYQGSMTTQSGIRWGPFLDLRHDAYHEANLLTNGDDVDISRDLGTVGFNVSYPLYRRSGDLTTILEPIAQFAVSPDAQQSPFMPNEDSQSVSFDETTLFSINRSPGFDIYEGGARLNLGLRGEWIFRNGWHFNGLIGRSFRNKVETQFLTPVNLGNGTTYMYDASGLANKTSDWIVTGDFDNSNGLYGYTRLRFDGDRTRLSQGEVGFSARTAQTMATVRYIVNYVLTPGQILAAYKATGQIERFGDNYKDIQIYGRHFFTPNWGVSARLDRDMVKGQWRRSTVSLIYRNDCIWYELVYERNDSELYNIGTKASSSLQFRLQFATLGGSNSDFTDVR